MEAESRSPQAHCIYTLPLSTEIKSGIIEGGTSVRVARGTVVLLRVVDQLLRPTQVTHTRKLCETLIAKAILGCILDAQILGDIVKSKFGQFFQVKGQRKKD